MVLSTLLLRERVNMKKMLVLGIVMLVFGSSVPALARTQSSLSTTISTDPASTIEDYKVYIGAGILREHEGKVGFGYHMTVENTGDTNITGFTYENCTTLFGKEYSNGQPFSLQPQTGFSIGSWVILDFKPITRITLTVIVGNVTYSKTGYEIGPLMLLVD
jgi:hypothetical protein